MLPKESKKNCLLTIAALVFLFATRWMYYRLEIDERINTLCFVAEGVLFIALYGLSLFRAPTIVSALTLSAGCVGLGILHGALDGPESPDSFLSPLAYLPVFVFFLDQVCVQQGKPVFAKIGECLMYGYPLILLGAIVFALKRNGMDFSLATAHRVLLCVILSVSFGFLARVPVKKESRKKQGQQSRSKKQETDTGERRMRLAFIFAIVVIPEAGVLSLLIRQPTLAHTLPILWIVNLLLLYETGHPLVCSAAARLRGVLERLSKSSNR